MRAEVRELQVEVERLTATVRDGVAATIIKGPCVRLKCKELKVQLSELQRGATFTPASSSRFRPDAVMRSQVHELEASVERLTTYAKHARAGRRESDVLSAELKATKAELDQVLGTAATDKLRAEELQRKLESQTGRHEAGQATIIKASESLSVARELCRHLEREVLQSKESAAEANARMTALEIDNAQIKAEKATLVRDFEEQQGLLGVRMDELHRLRMAMSAKLRWQAVRDSVSKEPKEIPFVDEQNCEWYDANLECADPKLISPESKARRTKMLRKKRDLEVTEIESLFEAIGEGRNPLVLAKVLEMTDSIDGLMETAEFWLRRITQGKKLIKTINDDWDSSLSARMKADYLLSNRDLDAMRVDWSCILVANKPRVKIALVNPFMVADKRQRVHFPEPITKRCRVDGWSEVLKEQTDHFGLVANPDHADATERDFDAVLQKLIDRDAHLLPTHEELGGVLNGVIGFDGADDFCHSCIRLVDYVDGVAKESELKGAGLTVAVGDDHNFNLNLQFRRIGPAINKTISTGGTFTLRGKPIRMDISSCLDYSASRSMYAKRSNSSPHSSKLHAHLIIEVSVAAPWLEIDKAIDKAMPWCPRPSTSVPLNHIFETFPSKCTRCTYKVGSEEEQDENIITALAMRGVKTKAGKKAWAARVKVFCEAHDEHMEFESAILNIHPRDNIVDMLHAIHINIPDRIASFSFHDEVNFAEDPELKHALTAYYTSIDCPFDMLGDKSWWHGSIWCYDFVMGCSKKSPGLDINILVCCLIVFGTNSAGETPKVANTSKPANAVINDLPGSFAPRKIKSKAKAPPDPLLQQLKPLFGSNAEKVRAIFESWTSYAEVFMAIHAKWESSSTEYKEERASRLYRAGIACLLTTPHAPRPSPHVHTCGVLS